MKKEKQNPVEVEKQQLLPLTFENYKLMLIGFVIIVIGFILMAGGGR